jgi:glutathione S-transferase
MLTSSNDEGLILVGRSSSHFTRITRIFAHELEVQHDFEIVYDITSKSSRNFGDNPTLRVPSLRTPGGTWFGSLPICREFGRRSRHHGRRIVFPEHSTNACASNAQEIITDVMGAEITIVMSRLARVPSDSPLLQKSAARIAASVDWLERELPRALESMPSGALSFLEVSAYCLFTHLGFREVMSIDDRPNLVAFMKRFGERASAISTSYLLDR